MAKNMRVHSEKRLGSAALLYGGALSQINRRIREVDDKKHEGPQ